MLNVTDGRTRSGSTLCAWFVEMPEAEAALKGGDHGKGQAPRRPREGLNLKCRGLAINGIDRHASLPVRSRP